MFKINLLRNLISVSILFLILEIILIGFEQQSFSKSDDMRIQYSRPAGSELKSFFVMYPSFPLAPGINQCEDSICAEHSQDSKERQAQTILNRVLNNSAIQELLSLSP